MGKPLLFLHGNGENHTYFDKQVPYFIHHGYQCILMDMRAHGDSSSTDKNLNFEVFANDVKAFLQHLQIKKISMIGFSDGANTAIQFALLYPEMLGVMILNGGNLCLNGMKFYCQVSILIEYYILSLLSFFIPSLKQKKKVVRLMAKYPNITSAQLQVLHIPTLVIVGEKDMIRREHSFLIKEAIKDSKYIEIPCGNHFIAKQMADEFNKEIHQFLVEVEHGR